MQYSTEVLYTDQQRKGSVTPDELFCFPFLTSKIKGRKIDILFWIHSDKYQKNIKTVF